MFMIEFKLNCSIILVGAQVITGGNYDVDLEIMSPAKRVLYKDMKKQYDSFTWTTDVEGDYQFCFSNEFSTFTHKLVYFDFQVINIGFSNLVLHEIHLLGALVSHTKYDHISVIKMANIQANINFPPLKFGPISTRSAPALVVVKKFSYH